MSEKANRPIGAAEIEITETMVEAGVQALNDTVALDVARPVLAEEDIVSRIYLAMVHARTLSSTGKSHPKPD